MYNVLSNREWAVVIWGIIFLIYVCQTTSTRISLTNIIKAFFAKKVILTFLITVSYISLLCWIFFRLSLWDFSMLKDTFLYFAWSIAAIIKIIDKRYQTPLNEIATEHIKVNSVLIAIIDFYSFSLTVELIFIPIIYFIKISELYSRKQKENKSINNFYKVAIKIIYVFLLGVSVYKTIQNPTSLFSKNFINSLLLPIILTLLLLPYYYLLSLYTLYEECFVALNVLSRGDIKEYTFRRNTLLKKCRLNLKKIKLVKSNWRPALCETNNDFIKELDAVTNDKKISYYGG